MAEKRDYYEVLGVDRVMRPLNRAAAVPADLADLALMAEIWEISLEIFLETFSEAAESVPQQETAR